MMNSLFGRQRFLEEGLEEWCLDAFAWLMRNLGGVPRLAATPLVLANTEFFPPTTTEGEARAAYLFEQVKALMGMSEWDCELRALDGKNNARVGEFWVLRSNAAAGTFQVKNGQAIISYSTDLIGDPRRLIAVFAHELCHYRLAGFGAPSPGEEIGNELLTDLAVAYFGFGLFAANAAFHFQQHRDTFSQGWSSQRTGYLSERTWAFAIALFQMLKGEPLEAARKALKPNIADMAGKAERYLAKNPDLIAPLRAIR
jgi:hypothetical protein